MKLALVLSLTVASAASANGLVLPSSAFSSEDKEALVASVEKARAESLKAFQSVETIVRQMPSLDAKKRGRYAPITQTMRLLGKDLLFPALEVLALRAPSVEMNASAALSLKMGLIESVGELKDARAVPVLKAILQSAQAEKEVYRSAGEALGRMGTDEAAATLISLSRGTSTRAQAVLSGMGTCRRLDVVQRLAQSLEGQSNTVSAVSVIKSLGEVGNSWAWRLEPSRASETQVRNSAAQALVQAFVKGDSTVRQAASNALMVIDAPATLQYVQVATMNVDARTKEDLQRLQKRFENNPVR